jgi:hypothetical protein
MIINCLRFDHITEKVKEEVDKVVEVEEEDYLRSLLQESSYHSKRRFTTDN